MSFIECGAPCRDPEHHAYEVVTRDNGSYGASKPRWNPPPWLAITSSHLSCIQWGCLPLKMNMSVGKTCLAHVLLCRLVPRSLEWSYVTKCLIELKKASWKTLQLAEFSYVPLTSEILTSTLLLISVLTAIVLCTNILVFLWTSRDIQTDYL